jgi:hypothetical protein
LSFEDLEFSKIHQNYSGYKNNFKVFEWIMEAKGLSSNLEEEREKSSYSTLPDNERKFLDLSFQLVNKEIEVEDFNNFLIDNAFQSIKLYKSNI